jgi:hypothetical protein
MPARTAFLSKFIGLYLILIGIPMAANKQASIATVIATVHDAPAVFIIGLVLVAASLALILCHNVWSGGAVPIIVTLVGWLALIKGGLFLFLPPPAAVGFVFWGSAYEQYFYADVALVLVLGIYLTYTGFKAQPRP